MEVMKERFLNLLHTSPNEATRMDFLLWLRGAIPEMISTLPPNGIHEKYDDLAESRQRLSIISHDIRKEVPLMAILPSESIVFPTVGPDKGLNDVNSAHLDAFLYDDDDGDRLVEEGKLSRAFCRDCGSKNTETLKFITHSCSKDLLEYIFTALLPSELEGKTLVDIGSRLGAVLYGGYVFSKCSRLIGIEVNPQFCELQQKIITKYKLSDRINVIQGEMTTLPEVMNAADIVVLNNAFDWFMTPDFQVTMWQFIRKTVRPGALLVTVPSLEETLKHLPTGFSLDTWVTELNPRIPMDEDDLDNWPQIKLYLVR